MISDIVVDLQYGDCGKGKVTHHLCRTGEYTHVIRYNGGCNAGHTIFHRGKKFITHHIPAGVFFGIRSIIGPGCVVNVEQFFKEIEELKAGGIDTDGLVFIAKNAHIITQNHIEEEAKEIKIDMLNKMGKEKMVYSVDVAKVDVGDTITWVPTSKGQPTRLIFTLQLLTICG